MDTLSKQRASSGLWLVAFLFFAPSFARAQVELGGLDTGATVSFVQTESGEWAIEIAGVSGPRILQSRPVQLEVFRTEDDIRQLSGGYRTVQRAEGGALRIWEGAACPPSSSPVQITTSTSSDERSVARESA